MPDLHPTETTLPVSGAPHPQVAKIPYQKPLLHSLGTFASLVQGPTPPGSGDGFGNFGDPTTS